VSESVEIVVRQPGQEDRVVRIHEGATRIGRAEDNEIVLSDVGVSRRHAQIYVGRGEVTVEDLGSGNGTWCNGYKVESQVVHDGDEIVIDPFTLVFRVRGHARSGSPVASSRNPAPARSPTARLDVVAGAGIAGQSYTITHRGLSIGRSEDRDVVIPDPAASRHHCQLTMQGGEVVLRDMGSANGVFVNAVRVRECTLADGDLVRIGNTEMRFVRPEIGVAQMVESYPPQSQPVASSAAPWATERPPRRRRPLLMILLGGAVAFVAMMLVLGAVIGGAWYLLSQQPPPPVTWAHQPPRWHLDLPPSLAAAPVDTLFDEGMEKMKRDHDARGALQDFYRVKQADPGYRDVDKFATAAGEALVLAALEREFKARAATKARRAEQRDDLLATWRKAKGAAKARAERTLETEFRSDPVVIDALGLDPSPEAQQAEAKVAQAIDQLNANELDAAARLFQEVLASSDDAALRRQVLAQLKLVQPNVARTSADLWQRGVLAEAAGRTDEARDLFTRLAKAHPSNPSARAHLERL
jgi:pSer/pThr/pTyr-binding forkhead associated (FHA) protein